MTFVIRRRPNRAAEDAPRGGRCLYGIRPLGPSGDTIDPRSGGRRTAFGDINPLVNLGKKPKSAHADPRLESLYIFRGLAVDAPGEPILRPNIFAVKKMILLGVAQYGCVTTSTSRHFVQLSCCFRIDIWISCPIPFTGEFLLASIDFLSLLMMKIAHWIFPRWDVRRCRGYIRSFSFEVALLIRRYSVKFTGYAVCFRYP